MNTWKQRTWGDINGGFSNAEGDAVWKCAEKACGPKPTSASGPTALVNWAKCMNAQETRCKQETSEEVILDQGAPSQTRDTGGTRPPSGTASWASRNKNTLIIGGVVLALGVVGIMIYKRRKK